MHGIHGILKDSGEKCVLDTAKADKNIEQIFKLCILFNYRHHYYIKFSRTCIKTQSKMCKTTKIFITKGSES